MDRKQTQEANVISLTDNLLARKPIENGKTLDSIEASIEHGKTLDSIEASIEHGKAISSIKTSIKHMQKDISEIKSAQSELRGEIKSVRSDLTNEIKSVRSELGDEIKSVRSDLTNEIKSVRSELGGEIKEISKTINKAEGAFKTMAWLMGGGILLVLIQQPFIQDILSLLK